MRFQIIFEKPNNWKLQIQFTKKTDVGLYECQVGFIHNLNVILLIVIMAMLQVSTNPPLIQYSFLNVVGESDTIALH